MMSGFKLPEPYTDGIVSNVRVEFDWRDRLRILFGAKVTIRVQTLVEHTPGRIQSSAVVDLRSFRFKWPWTPRRLVIDDQTKGPDR